MDMKASGKSRKSILLSFIVLFLIGMTSCFDSNYDFANISDEIEITPGISAPLAFGTLSLQDILNEVDSTGDFVKQFSDDSLLYIIYSENIVSYKGADLISIPNQDFLELFIDSDVAAAGVLSVPVGESTKTTKTKNGEFKFNNGEKIDSMNLKSVVMHVDVTSSFHHRGYLTIYSDSIFVDGKKFRKVIEISREDGTFTSNFDTTLNNVKLIMDNSDPLTTILPIKFDLELINSGAAVLPSEKCDITVSLNDNRFTSVFGYLGNYNLLATDGAIDITLFNEIKEGTLYFADPRISLIMNSSYGIPAELELSKVKVESKINNSTTDLIFSGVNPFPINVPGIDQFGETLLTEIPINKDNSNIDDLMKTLPHHLYYTAEARTNVAGNTGTHSDFVTDSSELDLDFEIILPIWIKAEGFSLTDTTEFDFEKEFGSDIDMIDYFRLSMDITNGMPVETKIQAYFTDASYNVLDSLFRDNSILLDAAETGPDAKVTTATNRISKVEYTTAELEKIKPSKYVIIKASANTPAAGTGYFKFYSFYGVDFKLSAKVDFLINSNDF